PVLAQTVLAHRGAQIDGALSATLSSKINHPGDPFTLDAKDTLFHHNGLPKGTVIDGHIVAVTPATATQKATMVLAIDDLALPDGTKAPLNARVVSLKEIEPHKHLLRDSAIIVGGAVAGHFVSKKTHVHGGTIAGAVAGFALVNRMKSDIVVKKGTILKLKAQSDVVASSS
ncbi:MAG: hypothetical protein JO101_01175, partial [Candidatus Eremiobacteraeota bacterium]|nr:hypothetical protein [Candidatus Eremiobacteraeota bacterium]